MRLARAGATEPEAAAAALERQGWISDESVAMSEVERCRRRRDGPGRLAQRLRQRGVDEGLVCEALAGVDPDTWWEQAWREAQRVPPGDGQRPRLARRLARLGYPAPMIARILERWDFHADGG